MALFAEFFGGVPDVPDFVGVDIGDAQKNAIANNLRNLPAAQELSTKGTAFNMEQINKMLSAAIPDYTNIQKQVSKNILAETRGEIPLDVSEAVQRSAAARALMGGYAGSSSHGNLVARDLGLTSLDLTERGLKSAESWALTMDKIYEPGRVDVSSMFITPTQQFAAEVEERNAKFQHDYVKAQWDWYGSFGQQAVRFEDSVVQLAAAVGGAAMAACWVAREVFGTEDSRWILFKDWMLMRAPKWFRSLYLKYGERFAKFISNKPKLKNIIRNWMTDIIEKDLRRHSYGFTV